MKGTLKNGFKFEVDDSIMDDMEFIELYRKAQDDPMYYIDVLTRMLGEDQKKALYESVRGKDGVVHVTDGDYPVTDALSEIFEAIQKSGTAGQI